PYSRRFPGIDDVAADLARDLPASLTEGIGAVVHCAAETAGGKQDHRRNSIDATRRLLEAAAAAGAKQVIHTSSIAVLVSSSSLGRPVDESAPIDPNTAARGPYVWGKAESEIVARQRGPEIGLDVKVIRPGPLVDYTHFHPPGRLGRELGPFFVGIGPKRGPLSVCDVTTAAQVVRSYLEDFAAAPPTLNLVESPPPERQELLARYRRDRADLSAIWLPVWFVKLLSGFAKIVQRLMGSKQPMDVAAAFASEKYDTTLAGKVIERARRSEAGVAPSAA
ncbi:MAG: NAD(P)-dependent oxidoreductase, partial [Acidobacteriota bacterium]